MDDEEEDIYAPDEDNVAYEPQEAGGVRSSAVENEEMGEDSPAGDESEEGEEDSDSDIDIITERKDGSKPEPPPHAKRVNTRRVSPTRIDSPGTFPKVQPLLTARIDTQAKLTPPPSKPGSSYPAIKTSNIDVNAKPIHEPSGKPITEVDMDADFPEDEKPWRRPGTDTTDFFNYGFDEFTWASYCLKQDSLRKEIVDQKKQMEEMQSFLGMPGAIPPVAPLAAPPTTAQPVMPGMGGAADMPPDLQAMMQQMLAQGIDPSQVDFNTFTQMMSSAPPGMGGPSFNQQAQNQQQMSYGYGAISGSGGQGNRNQGGRGQNRRW